MNEAERRRRVCAYYRCGAAPVVIARVRSGDADEMHETDNPLCGQHVYQVVMDWTRELVGGGPVKRMALSPVAEVGAVSQ